MPRELREALLLWREKHHIAEDDPALAILELLQLHAKYIPVRSREPVAPPGFEEFRDTLERIDQQAKTFGKLSLELIQELRQQRVGKAPSIWPAILLAAVAGIVTGFLAAHLIPWP